MTADSQVNKIAPRVALVTGAARRIGACTAMRLHRDGTNVAIHYGGSAEAARQLEQTLNQQRPKSAITVQGDLDDDTTAVRLIDVVLAQWERLDILVNNASTFYATPIGSISSEQVHALFGSNFRAPLFLAQAARGALAERQGVIINIIDVHAYRPYPGHPVYCAAKAALLMLTRSLALELAPDIRVNGIAPGSILWPEGGAALEAATKQSILDGIPLGRNGTPDDIANTVAWLASGQAGYITGQIIAVDGGRSL